MTRMTSLTLHAKKLTISLPHITCQLPRAPPPPPTPYPWVWRCHRCHAGRRFTASNRCLGCSHVFCTRCVSEYDYSGWEQWGAYYKRKCSTKEDTKEGSATEDRGDYKRDNHKVDDEENKEEEDEEVASLDAFELVFPPSPSIGHTHLDSDSESSESEDEDQESNVLSPPGNLSDAHNSNGDNGEDEVDDEEIDLQWTLSRPRPYISTIVQANAIPSFYPYGKESEPLDTRENNWDGVSPSPTEFTSGSGYSSVEEAMSALYSNSEEGEPIRDWSGCFGPTSSRGSETAMCGDEEDWEQPLWSPVSFTWDGFF